MENKSKKRSLKSSLLILLLTAVLLIVSTYAWFTSNQTVTVSSLNVNVEAKNGLQISVDGTNWKSIISNEDISSAITTYSAAKNQIPAVLEPVSTAGLVDTTTGYLNMYYGTVDSTSGTPLLTAVKETDANGTTGKYIAFDLFFKVDVDTPVWITPNSGVNPKMGTDGVTPTVDKGLKNASRMAFVNEGNLAPGATTAAIQALKGATDATVSIWEPNYDVHTPAGVQAAQDIYAITTTTTGGSVIPYKGVKAPISTGVALNSSSTDYFASVTPAYTTVANFSSNESFMTLSAGVTKIRMYMWIEGQDVDCENGCSGTDVRFDLQITSNNT